MNDMLSTKKALILQVAGAIGAQKFTPAEIEQVRRRRAHERFLRLQLRDQRFAGFRGIHASIQEKGCGVRIQVQRVLRNVDDRIRKEQQPGRQGLNVRAALPDFQRQGKIVRGVGLLKICLHDRVLDQSQGLRRFVQLKQKRGRIELKNVVSLLRREHLLQAGNSVGAG